MKTKNLTVALIALAVVYSEARAQNFTIDWFTIDGGGGSCTGGAYAVSGTIGQPDAGKLSGESYTLEGGFWNSADAGQMPALFITRSGTGAMISWTPNSPGFVLQVNDSLSPPGWSDAPSGGTNGVVVPITRPARFYRLRK